LAKKRKPLLFWLYDLIAARLDKKTPEEVVVQHVAAMRVAFRTELAGELAAALFAKKTLDTTRYVETPFPDAYFSGDVAIDAAAAPALMAYAQALVQFQAELNERGTAVSLAAARGMTTWIVTLYAMSLPGLQPQACELWAKLSIGTEGLEDAFKFLLRRAPSDVERTYFEYRPAALMPRG
jgi:hypothetical protein